MATHDLNAGDLQIREETADGPITLVWLGKSAERYPHEKLAPYFAKVLADAMKRQLGVEMRFERLGHFNSSTITTIIQFIQDARAGGVKLVLVYDPALKWQKLSFDAMRVFAKDSLLEVRTV
jgi:hypothetical protein